MVIIGNTWEEDFKMAQVWKVRQRMVAEKEFNELVRRNKGRGGQYNYVYMKLLASGGYDIGLLKEKSYAKSIIKQTKI